MRRVGDLYERIIEFGNLRLAARKALRGKKGKPRVAKFYFNLENELLDLQRELKEKTYRPRPLRRFQVREPKVREISAADFRDRVVHHAICNIVEPVLERRFIYHSYACRKGKGTHRAVDRAQQFSQKSNFFLKCDVRKFFDSVDHDILKVMLRRVFKDKELLWLLDTIIDSPGERKGLPIGNLTSQNFANLYLDILDHFIKDEIGVKGYIRYMDDFVLFHNSKEQLHRWHADIGVFLNKVLNLQLKEEATVLAPVSEGVPFLGFRIFPNLIRIKHQNKRRMVRNVKEKRHQYESGNLPESKYCQSLSSFAGHLKHANTYNLRRKIFVG